MLELCASLAYFLILSMTCDVITYNVISWAPLTHLSYIVYCACIARLSNGLYLRIYICYLLLVCCHNNPAGDLNGHAAMLHVLAEKS